MKISLTAFLMVCLFVSLCHASPTLEIYVHNRLLQGEVIRQGDEVYVQALELKKLIKGDLSWDEKAGIITVKGKDISARIIFSGNFVYVPLTVTARAMGYEVSYNRDTEILDVFRKIPLKPGVTNEVKPQQETSEAQTSSSSQSSSPQSVSGETKTEKDPLTINETGGAADSMPPSSGSTQISYSAYGTPHVSQTGSATSQGFRIYTQVTNGRKTEAKNVVASCVMKTQDGNVFSQQEVQVGTMKSGEVKEVIFFFPNDGGGIIITRNFSVKGD